MKYVYPCVFIPEEVGGFSVIFPDIAGATQGENLYEALYMAEDALALMLEGIESRGEKAPKPTPLEKIELPPGAFVSFIKVDTGQNFFPRKKLLHRLKKSPRKSGL